MKFSLQKTGLFDSRMKLWGRVKMKYGSFLMAYCFPRLKESLNQVDDELGNFSLKD